MGRWRDSPSETIDAILRTMGASDERPQPPAGEPVLFLRPGEARAVARPSLLHTEDGGEVRVDDHLPADLPLGYHVLETVGDGGRTTVVVSPGRCPLPAGAPTWGWAAQLYGMRSCSSWGMGDLADLRRLAEWSAGELGAGLVLVNPLHAALPGPVQGASPYFPSSRRFRNPLYLRVEDVPGAADALGDRLGPLAAAGRALNGQRLIDRDEVWRLKLDALSRVWERFPGDAAFDRWRDGEGGGAPLDAYATFCALVEEHGGDWRSWPEELRHPDRSGVAAYARRHPQRVRFHQWLQWLLDLQLESASTVGVAVVHDLAVGVDPGGADAWLWQDVFALDMAVGAPPDEFNTRGQDWGLPPFDPWRLRAAGYGPFVETIRAGLRHAGGLRLDHVMGLFRLYWIPRGRPATDGAYVRYPADDLLDIVALEAHRAGAYVVGEDLGTVEDEVREQMAARDLLSYRLLWFEDRPPREYPSRALAAVTTHDLPTVAGLWTGSDLADQRRLGMEPNEESTDAMCRRLQDMVGVAADASPDEAVAALYGALGAAPCLLLAAALDDAVAVPERPNMPGTVDEWPNWSIALPVTLEELMADPRPRAIARALDRRPQPGAGREDS
ncbi:MAG: 4-alpha-glucanotransferase [Actinomycetota bacterium]|jgi:4-alpha-glucanotransferase|nr:4-alpha-glucanotransferase [Actinomycetota bacterium]